MDDEFFGAPDKVALMRRAAALWELLKEQPRYSFYGRMVALSEPDEDAPARLMNLARVQGASVAYYYPKSGLDNLFAQYEAQGFAHDWWNHYRGGEAALAAARKVLAEHALPGDVTSARIDSATPAELVVKTAELCISCEVMAVPGSVMRGISQPGITLVALDRMGSPVAHAASYVIHHPESVRATDAFWGMLATREDRRGQRIALVLGAHAIVHMWEREGIRGFMTGVREGNISSSRLCNRLGVVDTEWAYAQCIDRAQLGGQLTK